MSTKVKTKNEMPRTLTGDQLSDDATVQHPPDNTGSTNLDPDHERPGGMAGGMGRANDGARPERNNVKVGAESRKLDPSTTPPSTPQGPASNAHLTAPEYRDKPERPSGPEAPTGEGSGVAMHSTGIPAPNREAGKEAIGKGEGRPVLDPAGRTPEKKEGTERNEP